MIADLKPYPDYKESGSPWLGGMPAHWNLPRLGSVLRERGETNEQKQVKQVLSVLKDARRSRTRKRHVNQPAGPRSSRIGDPSVAPIFLVMHDTFALNQVTGEARLVFDHPAAQAHFGASIFWLRQLAALPNEEEAVLGWQLKRDGTRRGIVEVMEA